MDLEETFDEIEDGKGKEPELPLTTNEPGDEDAGINQETAGASVASILPISRRQEDLVRKDRSLAEFLLLVENFEPIIPDAVTDYYLNRSGFSCEEVGVKRLMALAAQKFISDIATDAFQYCKIRQQSKKAGVGKRNKTILTLEDLSSALSEYGINIKKPDYYR